MSRNTTQGLRSARTSLLERIYSKCESTPLSEIQSEADSLVSGGLSTATDGKIMASFYAAGLAGRLIRLGTVAASGKSLVPFFLQGLSHAASLGGESAVFTFLERGWANPPGQIPQTFQKDWARSAITFGSLKFFGAAARSQSWIVQHLMVDAGMVASQGVGHALNLTDKPQGSLAEQLIRAEGTNLNMKASMAFLHGLSPRLSAIDRSLDLALRAQGGSLLPGASASFPFGAGPAEAMGSAAGGTIPMTSDPPGGLKGPGRFAMSAGEGGGGAGQGRLSRREAGRLISRARQEDPEAIEKLAKAAETDPEIVEDLYVFVVNGEKCILNILGRAAPKSRKAVKALTELASAGFEGSLDILAEQAKTVPWARGALVSLAYDGQLEAWVKLKELVRTNPEFERLLLLPKAEPLEVLAPRPAPSSLSGPLKKVGARLESSRWEFLRRWAAEELGRSGFSEARPPLEKALLHDSSPKVRKEAAIALGRISLAAAASSLKIALHDPALDVRIEAARSLSKLEIGTWNILTLLRKNGLGQGSKDGTPFPWEEAFFQARLSALAQEPRDKKYYGGLKKLAQEGSQKAALILFAIDRARVKAKSGEISKVTPESFIAEMLAAFPDAKEIEKMPLTESEALFFFGYFPPLEVMNLK